MRPARAGVRPRPSTCRLLQGLPLVLVGLPLLLMLIDWLIGFPSDRVNQAALLAGGGLGIAAFILMLLRGWRSESVWYPVVVAMLALGGAMIAVAGAAVATYFL